MSFVVFGTVVILGENKMAPLVVMKFGGSSIADADKIRHVASIIVAKSKAGNKVVAVVSAPGDTTDNLLEMAGKITSNPPSRENGYAAFIRRNDFNFAFGNGNRFYRFRSNFYDRTSGGNFGRCKINTRAKIKKINQKRVKDQLAKNNIVIVAGFQALNPNGDITTLGRGRFGFNCCCFSGVVRG